MLGKGHDNSVVKLFDDSFVYNGRYRVKAFVAKIPRPGQKRTGGTCEEVYVISLAVVSIGELIGHVGRIGIELGGDHPWSLS